MLFYPREGFQRGSWKAFAAPGGGASAERGQGRGAAALGRQSRAGERPGRSAPGQGWRHGRAAPREEEEEEEGGKGAGGGSRGGWGPHSPASSPGAGLRPGPARSGGRSSGRAGSAGPGGAAGLALQGTEGGRTELLCPLPWSAAGDAAPVCQQPSKLPVARRRWGSVSVLFGRMSRVTFLYADWDETISVSPGTGGEVKH